MEATACEQSSSPTNEIVDRVSAYLRCLGLPAVKAHEWALAAVERSADRGTGGDLDSAMADVMSRLDAWLTHLGEAGCPAARCSPDLLAWHLRPLLAEYPDVFLQHVGGEWEAPIRRAVEDAAQSALPHPTLTPMPTQSFGPVPHFLQAEFWRGLVRRGRGGQQP